MRKVITVLLACTTFAFVASPGALAAAPAGSGNPSGTGKPEQTCQELEPGNILPSTGAGKAPGSVFNEEGVEGSAGGTGGAAYNEAGAPSQYDVACYQTSIH
jgi:hypothetical protein